MTEDSIFDLVNRAAETNRRAIKHGVKRPDAILEETEAVLTRTQATRDILEMELACNVPHPNRRMYPDLPPFQSVKYQGPRNK